MCLLPDARLRSFMALSTETSKSGTISQLHAPYYTSVMSAAKKMSVIGQIGISTQPKRLEMKGKT
jgi:hypothetical protein